jgi:hypothetical protein
MKITNEFWAMGDREKAIGVPTSPLCDRERDRNIPQSQMGFFQFICNPYFKVVADLVEPDMAPHAQLQDNFRQWQTRKASATLQGKGSSNDATNSSAGARPPPPSCRCPARPRGPPLSRSAAAERRRLRFGAGAGAPSDDTSKPSAEATKSSVQATPGPPLPPISAAPAVAAISDAPRRADPDPKSESAV